VTSSVRAVAVRTLSCGTSHRSRAGQHHARPFGRGGTHRGTRTHDVKGKNVNVADNRSAMNDSQPSAALVSALTTEHDTLQAARSSTVAEANGPCCPGRQVGPDVPRLRLIPVGAFDPGAHHRRPASGPCRARRVPTPEASAASRAFYFTIDPRLTSLAADPRGRPSRTHAAGRSAALTLAWPVRRSSWFAIPSCDSRTRQAADLPMLPGRTWRSSRREGTAFRARLASQAQLPASNPGETP
jgi:hypothetical protein